MNKVMILGAGRGQIPLMNICHSYGWEVVAVSPQGNYPGISVADKVCYINVIDEQAVLAAAKREGIQAIITDQLDAGVTTAAYVSEKMGLRGISYNIAKKFTDKYIMRQEAKKLGVHVPGAISAHNITEVAQALKENNNLCFPLMMKPVDSAASCGVYKINSWDDIEDHFNYSKEYSKSGTVILEEFVEGKEFVVEAFTKNYKTTNLIVGHRDYFQIPNTFIPNATIFRDAVSADSGLEKRLKDVNKAIVEGFGLNFGITHGEYLYNETNDEIYLVEIAARGGGVFISSDLIPSACGVNANDLLVREALGLENSAPIRIKKGASAYFCYLLPSGTVSKLEGTENAEQIDGVIKAYFDNIELGMKSHSITDKTSRKGPILVGGSEKSDCYKIIENVKDVLNIKVITDKGEQGVIWHNV